MRNLVDNGESSNEEAVTGSQAFLDSVACLQNARSLLGVWRAHQEPVWAAEPTAYKIVAEKLLAFGEPLLAYDVLSEGLKHVPGDVRIRQLLALALARSGAVETANVLLRRMQEEGLTDQETLGLLARTYKDLWLISGGVNVQALQEARRFYLQAYTSSGGYWTGINAATLSAVLNELEQSKLLARRVREQCLCELEQASQTAQDTFWLSATLGEAALVERNWDEALEWYEKARAAAAARYADLNSARRNAQLLVRHTGHDWSKYSPVFRLPSVAVFVGHMIDVPGRSHPRFPAELEAPVKEEIRRMLQELRVEIGYASAASGSDILFLEAVAELGGETCIVLPYGADAFRRDSVDNAGGDWEARFEAVLGRAAQVAIASAKPLPGGEASFRYGNQILTGLALLRAQRLETKFVPVAVWDGHSESALGGTSDVVKGWQELNLDVHLINLERFLKQSKIDGRTDGAIVTRSPAAHSEFLPEVRALLFADAVGFSKLEEDQIPIFVRCFLGGIAGLLKRGSHLPILKNTWGDGLYFVFATVRDAGMFALELCEMVNTTNWVEMGLPQSLNLRIGLHAGPVYACFDPILERPNYVGTHVSRTARIEPVTPPGFVYASESFAALAAAEAATSFRCEYVGQTAQAKGYGTFPTYVVRRSTGHLATSA